MQASSLEKVVTRSKISSQLEFGIDVSYFDRANGVCVPSSRIQAGDSPNADEARVNRTTI